MIICDNNIRYLDSFDYLDEDDKKNLYCSFYYEDDFLKLENILYHFKIMDNKEILYELLGEMISNYFSLQTVRSELYKNNDKYYLLSKVFTNSIYKYAFLDDIFDKDILYGDLCVIENIKKYKDLEYDKYFNINNNYLKKLLIDLKKLAFVDYITGQNDRHTENFMFCYDKSYIELMPIYDYGILFENVMPYDCLLSIYLDSEKTINYIREDIVFNNLINKFLLLNINDIFLKLEKDYYIKLDSIEKENICNYINEKKDEVKKYKLIM